MTGKKYPDTMRRTVRRKRLLGGHKMSTSTTPRDTKKFKALLTVLNGNDQAAVIAWNNAHPEDPIEAEKVVVAPEVAQLMAAGFSKAEAEVALAKAQEAKASEPEPEPAPLTSKELADSLVAKAGLVHVRGRVYSNASLVEAQVRVLKTGKPELVRHAGERHTKAVIVYRLDDGNTVALQNLGEAN